MFTQNKFLSLPYKTRLRKLILIIQKAEIDFPGIDELVYIKTLLSTIVENSPDYLQKHIEEYRMIEPSCPDKNLWIRKLNMIRHALLKFLDSPPSEWDFIDTENNGLDASARRLLPIQIYLEDIRSPFNVGSIFRTAECFGASHIYLSPDTPLPTHKRALRTARGTGSVVSWSIARLDQLDPGMPVFALETGGVSINDFLFPQQGIVLIGSEELGLSPDALRFADKSLGRVAIPLLGVKRSLNVSVAFGIMVEHWASCIINHQKI